MDPTSWPLMDTTAEGVKLASESPTRSATIDTKVNLMAGKHVEQEDSQRT